jgi:hypothetical protein
MTEKSLVQKLRMQSGQRVLIANAPIGYVEGVGQLPEGVQVDTQAEGEGLYDFVHLFVLDRRELDRLGPGVTAAAKYDAVLWISYPKTSSGVATDLTRDVLWGLVPGFRPVSQVAVDDVWSAVRFRPTAQVGK